MERYLRAREFAIKAHGDQKYGEGEPYVAHLDDVANVLRGFGYDSDLYLTLAYLHDVLEDTEVTAVDIKAVFNDPSIIAGTLFLTDVPGPNRKIRKQQTYARCRKTILKYLGDTSTPYRFGVFAAVQVKLADRIANLRRSVGTPLMKMYQKEREAFRSAYYCAKPGDDMWAEYDRLVGTPVPVKMTVELSDGSRRFLSGENLTQWLSDSGAAIVFAQEHGCVTKPWTIQDWETENA